MDNIIKNEKHNNISNYEYYYVKDDDDDDDDDDESYCYPN